VIYIHIKNETGINLSSILYNFEGRLDFTLFRKGFTKFFQEAYKHIAKGRERRRA
jgi:ribosomal protein S4